MTITTDETLNRALNVAAGNYQENVLRGIDDWSGSSLRGNAKDYASKYAESRRGLLDRLTKAGMLILEVRVGTRRRHDVVIAAEKAELHALAVEHLSADVAALKSPAARARRLAEHLGAVTRTLGGSGAQILAELAAAAPLPAAERRELLVDAAARMQLTHHQRLALVGTFKWLVGDGERAA